MKPPFKFSARTRVGFSDTDAQGIVYYGRYNPYFDLARVEYLRSLGLLRRPGEAGDFVMRANDVEYFAPAVFDDEIEVFVRVSRLGRTSVTFTFVTPLFGVVASYFIMHDRLTLVFGVAALLVIAGLYLVNKPDAKVVPDPNLPA